MNTGPKPHGMIRMVIRQNQQTKTVDRGSQSNARFGESSRTTDSTPSVDMWLFSPTENNIGTAGGERLDGDLMGLALDTADVQVGDQVSHGSDTYEVETIIGLPNDDATEYKRFSLTRVVNP